MILLSIQSWPTDETTGFKGHTQLGEDCFDQTVCQISQKACKLFNGCHMLHSNKTYNSYRAPAPSILMLYSPCLRRNHRLFEVAHPMKTWSICPKLIVLQLKQARRDRSPAQRKDDSFYCSFIGLLLSSWTQWAVFPLAFPSLFSASTVVGPLCSQWWNLGSAEESRMVGGLSVSPRYRELAVTCLNPGSLFSVSVSHTSL